MKKIISLILSFAILGINIVYAYDYAPDTYSLDFSFISDALDSSVSGNTLTLSGGGYATFSDELMFSAASVTVTTKYDEGSIRIVCGEQSVELSFGGGNVQTAEFAYPVHKDTKNITVYGLSNTVVTDICFNRVDLDFPLDKKLALVNMPQEEYLTQSAVIMKINGTAYYSNGAVRYIDYSDTNQSVRLIDGKMYAPAQAVATALHLYWEIISEKAYVLFRNDNDTEFLSSSDTCYYTKNTAEKIAIENPVIYVEGEPFVPFRQICELFGRTVIYKDGYAVADTYKRATDIVKSASIWKFVTNKLNEFSPSMGNIYYVAQTAAASDDNEGTEKKPFRTISKACAVAESGDTVYIHGGTYRETLNPQNSGSSAAPITFKAVDGENVVISALEQVNSFATYNDGNITAENVVIGMMASSLPQGRNQVFYNGRALGEGRHPNSNTADLQRCAVLNLSDMWPTFGDIVLRDYTPEESTLKSKPKLYELVSENDLNQTDNYWSGGTYIGLQGAGWSVSTGIISSSTAGKITVDSEKATETWWFGQRNTGDFGYITNHIHTVDMPGEWFVDTSENILYVCLPEGETANSLRLEYKARQLAVDLRDRNNIILEGINTIGGGITAQGGNMNVINKCKMKYISHYSHSDDQRDGFIDNKDIRTAEAAPARGETGLYIDGENNVIANSIIDHSAGAGIYSSGSYALIENNEITDCGYMGSYVSGITMEGPGWETDKDYKHGGEHVYKNTVRRAGRACISVASVVDNLTNYTTVLPFDICYNDISDGMICGRDGGVVYEHGVNLGNDITRAKFHHNSICNQWEPEHSPRGGLYHDNCVVYQESFDNMIYFNNEIGMSPRVYTQNRSQFPTTYAVTYEWGNTRFDNRDNLTLDQIDYCEYPGGKAFKLGSDISDGKFTYNYDNRNVADIWYSPTGSLDSDNYVTFENVNFGTDNNVLSIYYSGNKYNTGDVIDVIVGASVESGTRVRTEVLANTTELSYSDSFDIAVGKHSGNQNVYIKAVDYKSLRINKLRTYKDDARKPVLAKLYGGDYDELTPGRATANPIHKYLGSDPRHSYINNTWAGTVLKYNAVEFTSDFNSFIWSAGTGDIWSGNTVTVYFDSLESEPVGEFIINTTDWTDFSEKSFALNKTVAAGTHDVYIVFGGVEKSSDWYYIGFAAE